MRWFRNVCVASGSKPCHNHISQSASLIVGGVVVVGKLSQAKPLDFGQLYLTLHNSTRNSTQNSPHDSCWRIRGTAVFRAVQRRWPSDSWLQPVRCVTPQQRWWCAFFFSFQRSTSSSNSCWWCCACTLDWAPESRVNNTLAHSTRPGEGLESTWPYWVNRWWSLKFPWCSWYDVELIPTNLHLNFLYYLSAILVQIFFFTKFINTHLTSWGLEPRCIHHQILLIAVDFEDPPPTAANARLAELVSTTSLLALMGRVPSPEW